MTTSAKLRKVYRVDKCKRRCLTAPLTGRDKDRFGIDLIDLTDFPARLILRARPEGFQVEPRRGGGDGAPLDVKVTGKGSWAGLRVTGIARLDD